MSLIHPDRMQILLGRYAVGDASCLVDPSLVAVAQDYRRQAQARMMPLDAEQLHKKLPVGEYHCSLKIDGEFNVLVFQDGEAILVNPGGTVRAGLPVLDQLARQLQAAGVQRAVLAGELWYQRPERSRCRVHDVTRVARNPQSPDELARLRFVAFDLIELDGCKQSGSFAEKWALLERLVPTPPAVWLKHIDLIQKQFDEWVAQGHEGIVLRSEAADSYKVKPRHSIDAVVIGFTEGDLGDRIHDLLVALMRADGTFQVLGRVGGGFTDQARRDWACDLKDWIVGSDHVETNDGVAYHMVRPRHVIEISCLDVIAQNTRGQPIMAACLEFGDRPSATGQTAADSRQPSWHRVGKLPLAALIAPHFVRRRDDKRPDSVLDLRLSQVSDLVEVPLADRDARQLTRPKSEILKRGVWTKQQKGQTMVRKLLMWATHKAEPLVPGGLADFPAYVIACTDYSPGRAEPLQRDGRVSNCRAQIDELWDELAKEKVVKGWVAA
jgi:hypothetical protein